MRKKVADSLLEIVNEINEAIENKNDDEKIIFKSISLQILFDILDNTCKIVLILC